MRVRIPPLALAGPEGDRLSVNAGSDPAFGPPFEGGAVVPTPTHVLRHSGLVQRQDRALFMRLSGFESLARS